MTAQRCYRCCTTRTCFVLRRCAAPAHTHGNSSDQLSVGSARLHSACMNAIRALLLGRGICLQGKAQRRMQSLWHGRDRGARDQMAMAMLTHGCKQRKAALATGSVVLTYVLHLPLCLQRNECIPFDRPWVPLRCTGTSCTLPRCPVSCTSLLHKGRALRNTHRNSRVARHPCPLAARRVPRASYQPTAAECY